MPLLSAWVCRFQSTLPLRGATYDYAKLAGKITISIHAPLTGSDCIVDILRGEKDDFNPRSPYGERHWASLSQATTLQFQSTLPLRGATSSRRPSTRWTRFQSTLPLRGATLRGAQQRDAFLISIHAPLTGSDPRARSITAAQPYFNPRSPYGERPTHMSGCWRMCYFNPRSPYGERPLFRLVKYFLIAFQSTLPLRGATF